MEMRPPTALSEQQTTFALQALEPPIPIIVRGEHEAPIRRVTSFRTMPRRPRRRFPARESALSTCSQHCKSPVLHWLASVMVGPGAVTVTVTVGAPQGLAAARNVRDKTNNRIEDARENILSSRSAPSVIWELWRSELQTRNYVCMALYFLHVLLLHALDNRPQQSCAVCDPDGYIGLWT